MELNLKNKIVLITGSSRGIGLEIAKKFLEEKSIIIITSRSEKELKTKTLMLQKKYKTKNVHYYTCDFTNEVDIINLKKKLKKKFSKIDVLITNVGSGTSVTDAIPSKTIWKNIWSINFESTLLSIRNLLDLVKPKGSYLAISSIVSISALGAPTDYSVAKTALNSLIKNVSSKVAQPRMNIVSPGNIYFKNGSWEKKYQLNPKKTKKYIKDNVPLNRFGKPTEIANLVVFLSSEKASFIHGSNFVIDGGQTKSIL